MGLTFNGKTPSAIQIGGKQVDNIVMNGEVVWPDIHYEPYFYIENLYGGNNTITLTKVGSPSSGTTLAYSFDKTNWTTCAYDSNNQCSVNLSSLNDRVYFKSDDYLSTGYTAYYKFSGNQNHKVGGDVGSLTTKTRISNYELCNLFEGDVKLIDASLVDFSKMTQLGKSSCEAMFRHCSSLTKTPRLPNIDTAEMCYDLMFSGCTSLTTAPALPALNLANSCYNSMFYGCTSLTTAPALPATNTYSFCYSDMFSGCTSLTTAPQLPATNINIGSYQRMFKGCTSLVNPPEILATTLIGGSGLVGCCTNMFEGCTALIESPVLYATTLVEMCYYHMFQNCTSLNKVTSYASTIPSSNCLSMWLSNVSSSGDFYNLGGATYPSGANGIPTGWTVHTSL